MRCFGSTRPPCAIFPSIVALVCTVRTFCLLSWFSFSGCVDLAATESWWHRHLRRFRSQARLVLRSRVWKGWSRQKIQQALISLQHHHGSRPPKTYLSKMSQRIANLQTSSMWTCRFCQVKHTCAQAHCESCNRHWKQADAASGPRSQSRRSRRQQKGNGERKKADQSSNQVATKDGKATEQEDAIFSNNLPWVASSPHGRPQVMDVKPSTEEASAAMPIPPETKPSAPLGEEDIAKLHQNLKALKQTLGSLPAELEQKLAMCEEKAREKALSHGHLNRLGKLTKQMKNLASKIQSMDEGWQGFAQKVAAKFEEHRKWYHSSRESLVQEYLVKSQELQVAKQEVQLASQHLFAEQTVPPTPSATEETMMLMEQAIQEDAQFGAAQFDDYQADLTGSLEDDELMSEMDHANSAGKSALRPFARRVIASPSKVANLHLKAKETEKKGPPTPTK